METIEWDHFKCPSIPKRFKSLHVENEQNPKKRSESVSQISAFKSSKAGSDQNGSRPFVPNGGRHRFGAIGPLSVYCHNNVFSFFFGRQRNGRVPVEMHNWIAAS